MFSGTVSFAAEMPGLKFGRLDVNLAHPGVSGVRLIAEDGETINVGLSIAEVITVQEGIKAARAVAERVLNRLAYIHDRGISDPVCVTSSLNPTNPSPGYIMVVNDAVHFITEKPTLTLNQDSLPRLIADLEQPSPIGERHYGLFRSALAARDALVQFLQLYHILLLFHNDCQQDVDGFILGQNPTVPQDPSPIKPLKNETVYTRLRNEFAHFRAGVSLEQTKREMTSRVAELIQLTKKAIELNP